MTMNFPSDGTEMTFCDLFTECWHCPIPYCPYEKLGDGSESGFDDEADRDDEDDEEGW